MRGLDSFTKYEMESLSQEDAELLKEQYLISPALISGKRGAAFVTEDKAISIMVNEEDHLRLQYIYKDFDLRYAYERISAVDDGLNALYDFAFDDRLGYLTACPSNLGTGMRASVMMFLPGLSWSGELKEYIPELKKRGLTVRGAFGEGSRAEGYVFQISNERTLGLSEKDILTEVEEAIFDLCDLENRARMEMLERAEVETKDRCLRAYGVLTHCVMLSMDEFLSKMTDVKLGILLGLFSTSGLEDVDNFIDGMRPMSFRLGNGLRYASEKECDIARAETVRRILPELAQVTKKYVKGNNVISAF